MEIDEFPSFEVAADDTRGFSARNKIQSVYEALPSGCFRLLRILPGDPKSEVCCEMSQYAFDDQIEYTALSYVWGSGPDDQTIRLNGTRIYVRKNIWRFLRQARAIGHKLSGLFWIDALAINQSDYEEKTSQVTLMPRIYSKAVRVVVWLGPSYAGSDQAMKNIARPASYWRAKKHTLKFWGTQSAAAVCGLCERPYWTRLWVFQELLLAQNVVLLCGGTITPFERLRDFLSILALSVLPIRVNNRHEHSIILASPAKSMIDQTNAPPGQSSLMELIRTTNHLHCSEVRDKVYALLGVTTAGDIGIDSDYTIPLPTLLNAVLRNQHKLEPPKTISEVEAQCQELASLFNVPLRQVFDLNGQRGCFPAPEESDMIASKLGAEQSWINLWWTSFYGHDMIEDLLFKEGIISNSDLLYEAEAGNLAATRLLLLSRNVDVNWKHENDKTALYAATLWRHAAVVELLLDEGKADANCAYKSHETPLHVAVKMRDLVITKLLIHRGRADVNIKGNAGATAIHIAAKNGNLEIVRLLLEAGADATCEVHNRLTHDAFTPIHWAAAEGHEAIVECLLTTGKIDANLRNAYGRTALHLAVEKGKYSVVVALLNESNIHVNAANGSGDTALHLAAEYGKEAIVRLLFDKSDVDVNMRNKSGQTALHNAAEKRDETILNLLVNEYDADANILDQDGNTALHTAAHHGMGRNVELLLDDGKADADIVNRFGRKALTSAVMSRKEAVAKQLFEVTQTDVDWEEIETFIRECPRWRDFRTPFPYFPPQA